MGETGSRFSVFFLDSGCFFGFFVVTDERGLLLSVDFFVIILDGPDGRDSFSVGGIGLVRCLFVAFPLELSAWWLDSVLGYLGLDRLDRTAVSALLGVDEMGILLTVLEMTDLVVQGCLLFFGLIL
jgi:hypothetical protein